MQNIRDQSISQIEQQTQEREQQVQQQFNELQALAQNPEAKQKLDEQIKAIELALSGGQVPPQQIPTIEAQKQELMNFQRFANDPEALSGRMAELQGTVNDLRDKQQQEAENNVLKEVIQISLRSLLLGIGYVMLGWLGLQNILSTKRVPEEIVQDIPLTSETPSEAEE
jgi:hypothetical protein